MGRKGTVPRKDRGNPCGGRRRGRQEQDVNAFSKGKGKGGKGGYWPYQGAWNGYPSGTGYQGICWSCGEVGHQQKECPKKIQQVDCDNVECDFFFGAIESEGVEPPPISDFKRRVRRIGKGVKFGECAGECKGRCNEHWDRTGNVFATLCEEKMTVMMMKMRRRRRYVRKKKRAWRTYRDFQIRIVRVTADGREQRAGK